LHGLDLLARLIDVLGDRANHLDSHVVVCVLGSEREAQLCELALSRSALLGECGDRRSGRAQKDAAKCSRTELTYYPVLVDRAAFMGVEVTLDVGHVLLAEDALCGPMDLSNERS
jgi:hypothetical protein